MYVIWLISRSIQRQVSSEDHLSRIPAHEFFATVAPFRAWRGSQVLIAEGPRWKTKYNPSWTQAPFIDYPRELTQCSSDKILIPKPCSCSLTPLSMLRPKVVCTQSGLESSPITR